MNPVTSTPNHDRRATWFGAGAAGCILLFVTLLIIAATLALRGAAVPAAYFLLGAALPIWGFAGCWDRMVQAFEADIQQALEAEEEGD